MPQQLKIYMDLNSLNNIERGPPKEKLFVVKYEMKDSRRHHRRMDRVTMAHPVVYARVSKTWWKTLQIMNNYILNNNNVWQLPTINGFTYVGIYFTNRLYLKKMSEAMEVKAKKVPMHLLNSFNNLHTIRYRTIFWVFDSKVSSVLLYDSEIWLLRKNPAILKVYKCIFF